MLSGAPSWYGQISRCRPSQRHLAALLVDYILLKETVVWLIGVDGAIRDQQFAVDTDTFDIRPPWRQRVGERP